MSDATTAVRNLRERLTGNGEDRLGKALSDLLDNPLLTGAIGRAFDAREKAAQAQELAMGALNIPSAADIERLTRRLRAVSQRLEGIEDGVHRLDRALAAHHVESRLEKIEEQLGALSQRLDRQPPTASKPQASAPRRAAQQSSAPQRTAQRSSTSRRTAQQSGTSQRKPRTRKA